MTIEEIVEARKQGHTSEAYDAIRDIYATDKSPRVKAVMFWTAFDMLNNLIDDKKTDEAERIYKALLRLFSSMNDANHEREQAALAKADRRLHKGTRLVSESDTERLGRWGESVAADYLRKKGYHIIAHDWRSGHRDIDLVAMDGAVMVFVEVKTRTRRIGSEPEMAVDRKKLINLQRAIFHYIHMRHAKNEFRFDIVVVIGKDEVVTEITHWKDVNLYI